MRLAEIGVDPESPPRMFEAGIGTVAGRAAAHQAMGLADRQLRESAREAGITIDGTDIEGPSVLEAADVDAASGTSAP